MKKNAVHILKIVFQKIYDESFKNIFRESEKDFTRNRTLSFSNTLIFMLNLIRKSLAIEIHNFTQHFANTILILNLL